MSKRIDLREHTTIHRQIFKYLEKDRKIFSTDLASGFNVMYWGVYLQLPVAAVSYLVIEYCEEML